MPGPDIWEVVILDVIALALVVIVRIFIALYVPPPYGDQELPKNANWLQKFQHKLRIMTHKKVKPLKKDSVLRKQYEAEAAARRSEERERIILDEKLEAETIEQLAKDKEAFKKADAARKEEEKRKKEEKKRAKAQGKEEHKKKKLDEKGEGRD